MKHHIIVLGRDERIQHGQHGHLFPSAKDTFLEMDDSPTDILPECLVNIDGFWFTTNALGKVCSDIRLIDISYWIK